MGHDAPPHGQLIHGSDLVNLLAAADVWVQRLEQLAAHYGVLLMQPGDGEAWYLPIISVPSPWTESGAEQQ